MPLTETETKHELPSQNKAIVIFAIKSCTLSLVKIPNKRATTKIIVLYNLRLNMLTIKS